MISWKCVQGVFTLVWTEWSWTRFHASSHSLRLQPCMRHTISLMKALVTLKKLISVSLNVYLEVHHILCKSHSTFQKSVWWPCHRTVTAFRILTVLGSEPRWRIGGFQAADYGLIIPVSERGLSLSDAWSRGRTIGPNTLTSQSF